MGEGGSGGSTRVRLLPAKEELGNLARDLGTVPVRLLLATIKSCKFGRTRSGSSPDKELLERSKEVSFVRLEIEEGMLPLKALKERLSTVRFFQTDKFEGSRPVNWLD